MITSKDNEKLKLIRKLGRKKYRERLGLFVTEGEDLARAGLASGRQPYALLVHPDCDLAGEAVEPELLDGVASLASGTRAIGVWTRTDTAPDEATDLTGRRCVFLDGVADPGNVGSIIRTVDALLDATVVLGPGTADHLSPGAVRASMGSVFTQPVARATITDTPRPRVAMVAHDGERPGTGADPATVCLGAERDGLSEAVVTECEHRWTVPLRSGAAESLNVAAAAAIACERISSPVVTDHPGGTEPARLEENG